MDVGSLLNDRFRITDTLGQRRLSTTYLALDTQTDQQCVVKQLSVRRAYAGPVPEVGAVVGSDAAKLIELFEREGRVLEHLDHPQIPKLVDVFTVESELDTHLYLVQEHVHAQSLEDLVTAGRHFTEAEVVDIAVQVAEILEYLHGRSPPLIHRDLKPSNILYDDAGRAYLVDFGAVKDRLVQYELEGSTVVGTYGYMPLEQHEGNAVPASDIYSLGATLIAVLSHLEPSDIGRRDMKFDFRPHVQVSAPFGNVLAKMVEPDLSGRYRSASELKRDLEGSPAATPHPRLLRYAAAAAAVGALAAGLGPFAVRALKNDNPVTRRPGAVSSTTEALPEHRGVFVPVAPTDGVLRLDIYESFRYVDSGWPHGLSVTQTVARGLDVLPYEPLLDEPKYRSDEPLYGYLPLGNGPDSRITFVIDELDRPTWVAYVDKNNNNDLTDDGPPLQNQGTGTLAVAAAVSVDLVTASGATLRQPYHLWLWVSESERDGALFARLYGRCHYEGRVVFGGREFLTVAYEYDRHNALFAENGIWIDLNENGELERTEHFLDGELIRVGDDTYRLELDYP
jgi:hypothetical protein